MIMQFKEIAKSYGGRTLFENVNFQINKNDKLALIGANGTGKTTLMRIALNLEHADAGKVLFAKDVKVAYLEQEIGDTSGISILEEVKSGAHELLDLQDKIIDLEQKISKSDPQSKTHDKLLYQYGNATQIFEERGGYELESKARSILFGLGFGEQDIHKDVSNYSGGWQMRINLAKLLFRNPDLLLLDEPTNHLDAESVTWLESFLSAYQGSIMLISHDRSFMDGVVNKIAALENGKVTIYKGNYTQYKKAREEQIEQLYRRRKIQEEEIEHLESYVERFRFKSDKAKQAQARLKKIEKLKQELVDVPERKKHIDFTFPPAPHTGKRVIRLENIKKSYGKKEVFKFKKLDLYRTQRVAIVGPNGAGKSTLLKLIAGKIDPTEGTREVGKDVTISYYAQHQLDNLNPKNTVFEEIQKSAPTFKDGEIRALLGIFLFKTQDDVSKKISVLSGGEKARLALAKMLIKPAPLLCLDEPTNHLDIESIDILLQALSKFEGTIVFITHDRDFIKKLGNRIIDVRDKTITSYEGDYEYYKRKMRERSVNSGYGTDKTNLNVDKKAQGNQSKFEVHDTGYKSKDQKRAEAELRQYISQTTKELRAKISKIERELEEKQSRHDELMNLMADKDLYDDKEAFTDIVEEYGVLKNEIPLLEDEWLELSTKLEEEVDAINETYGK